jgi:cytochrome c oxidase subunit 2
MDVETQHPEGPREINELHVPVGKPVKLIMTSEDDPQFLYPGLPGQAGRPAGALQLTVVPGDADGRYHLFCAQFCGTSHSAMVGSVVVMAPLEFAAWLGNPGTQSGVTETRRSRWPPRENS